LGLRVWCRRALASVLLGCSAWVTACGVLGPPGGERPYAASPVTARPTASAVQAAAPSSADSQPANGGANGAPPVRLLRPSAGAADSPSAPRHGYLPDPAPLSTRAWWAYDVRYDRGVIEPGAPALQCLEQPVSSARRLGRYSFELWIGAELIERIRFDFPLLAGEVPRSGPRRPLREEPSFAPGARVSTRILVPASPRATRAEILDRATGQSIPVPWPPARSADTSGTQPGGTSTGRSPASGEPCGNAPVTPTPPTR
jgi:hypothetical protein